MDHKGVSLLEILLSAIIFLIAVTGVFYSMVAVRTPVAEDTNGLQATVAGQRFLEGLRSTVGAGGYDPGGPLSVGNGHSTQENINGVLYTFQYNVTCSDGTDPCDSARKVDLDVSYSD